MEISLAVNAHKRTVAWHWNSCIEIQAGRRRGSSSLLFLVPQVHEEFDSRWSMPGKMIVHKCKHFDRLDAEISQNPYPFF
jgi:hypothetical protein